MKGHMSLYEFNERFPDDESATEFFENRRWPGGIYCQKCGCVGRISRMKSGKPQPFHCLECGKFFSVRTSTLLAESPIPLRKWLMAMYLINSNRKGISSVQLAKQLGVTQKTGWFLAHRIREAYDENGGPLGPGEVEIDESFIGGKEANKHKSKKLNEGRGAVGKQSVMGIKERGGDVRAFPIDGTDGATVKKEIARNVRRGSTVYTDSHAGYTGIPYDHETVAHTVGEYVRNQVHTNGIESFWALLKRGHYGIYHQMSFKHLSRYLTEFSGRHNMKGDTMECLGRIASGMFGKRLTYKGLIG